MQRLLKLVLLLGVMVGLFGQTMAMAAAPTCSATMRGMPAMHGATTAISNDCMDMCSGMKPDSAPCKKMSLQCLAAMGCTVPMFLEERPSTLSQTVLQKIAPTWPTVERLVGRSYGPEPDPPSFLS